MARVVPSKLSPMFSHRDLDLKSLALHKLVVQKIRANPSLISKARDTLERMAAQYDGAPRTYTEEWIAVLEQGIEVALAIATADTERGQVMRSASPFAGILTEKERLYFLKAWAARRAADPT